jgi:hypothetical protein
MSLRLYGTVRPERQAEYVATVARYLCISVEALDFLQDSLSSGLFCIGHGVEMPKVVPLF